MTFAKHPDAASLFTDLLPITTVVAAAILAAAFQRRISYLQALRDLLWKQLVPAIQTAIQYTHAPTPELFAKAHESVSTAIDAREFFPERTSNHSMKPTAPLRNAFSVFATTPCRGLSLSR